jgi:hypothetical protein
MHIKQTVVAVVIEPLLTSVVHRQFVAKGALPCPLDPRRAPAWWFKESPLRRKPGSFSGGAMSRIRLAPVTSRPEGAEHQPALQAKDTWGINGQSGARQSSTHRCPFRADHG